jgi:uncharacterized paraquat-inducible protein A
MKGRQRSPKIACLACGATRTVSHLPHGDTGQCPRCDYVGWVYAEDLDSRTRHLIMNGAFGRPPRRRRRGILGRPGAVSFKR